MVIKIKIDDKDITSLLTRLAKKTQYMQPIMRQIAEIIYGKKAIK